MRVGMNNFLLGVLTVLVAEAVVVWGIWNWIKKDEGGKELDPRFSRERFK